MIAFLCAGIVLGMSAGLSPGPLLTLVISQTLKHSIKEGVKVALAPLITDLPIILISTFVLSRLANFRTILGIISLVGGLFVMYLAYESFQTSEAPRASARGIFTASADTLLAFIPVLPDPDGAFCEGG